MRILVTNDDGVYAPGLTVLAEALSEIAEVTVVAPDRNHSAVSHALTINNPIRTSQLENGYHCVEGTPTDCVFVALRGLLTELPDIVVSGINAGANLGDDTLYSGTVAAAAEGRYLGLPSVAVSLCADYEVFEHYETAAHVAKDVVKKLAEHDLAMIESVININVPDLPLNQLKGVKVTRLGNRHLAENMVHQTDPRGKPIWWVGPPLLGENADVGEGTDFHAIVEGYASLTPLKMNLTNAESIQGLADWLEK